MATCSPTRRSPVDPRSRSILAELTDGVLADVWAEFALRAHRIAHRDLRLANMFLADDGTAWIIDFGFR
jgi:undecaprenyl-diphosphatase